MSVTLVLSDIHHRIAIADRIMESTTWDACRMLGDYQDDFGDSVDDAIRTAEWLRDILKKPEIIGLRGNHDNGYGWGSSLTRCSGWTAAKNAAINKVMKRDDWNKLRSFCWVDGWLLSHAGFRPEFVGNPYSIEHKLEMAAYLETEAVHCHNQMENGSWHNWLSISRLRGGMQPYGGPYWLDEREFRPIPGCSQCVGHTPNHYPRSIELPDGSKNVFLDTHSRHYALIKDGNMEVKAVPPSWLKEAAAARSPLKPAPPGEPAASAAGVRAARRTARTSRKRPEMPINQER